MQGQHCNSKVWTNVHQDAGHRGPIVRRALCSVDESGDDFPLIDRALREPHDRRPAFRWAR